MNLTELLKNVINSTKEITDNYIGDFVLQGHYEKVVSLHHLFKSYNNQVDICDSSIDCDTLSITFPFCEELNAFISDVKCIKGRESEVYNILIESNPTTITMLLK